MAILVIDPGITASPLHEAPEPGSIVVPVYVKDPLVQSTGIGVAIAGTTLKLNKITKMINIEKIRIDEAIFSFSTHLQKGISLETRICN